MRDDVVALYVDPRGPYPKLVREWYDEKRDARTYAGPWPVVAHPPCSRWCALAPLNEARYGHKIGDDGGLFAHALAAVRQWGGVLEHPANSYAWPAFGLTRPRRGHGWERRLFSGDPGWVCEVSQSAYGHRARKLTWLYYVGTPPVHVEFAMGAVTGRVADLHHKPYCQISALRNHGGLGTRMYSAEARRTPIAFAEWLLELAATATPRDLTARASAR